MSVEKAKEFLRECRRNEEAVRILEQLPRPKSQDEAIAQLVEAAGRIGIQITAEDVAEAVRELEQELRARTDAAADGLQAIDDDSLEEAAGGIYYFTTTDSNDVAERKRVFKCFKDFTDTSCLNEDACKYVSIRYYDCDKVYYEKGEEYDCYYAEFLCLSNFFYSPDPLP